MTSITMLGLLVVFSSMFNMVILLIISSEVSNFRLRLDLIEEVHRRIEARTQELFGSATRDAHK